jgi:hypothetical protein
LHIEGKRHVSNFVPLTEETQALKYYTMFSWGHLLDILWAWSIRSWLFWPLLIYGLIVYGWRTVTRADRLFLLAYTLCFTFFALVWHPDLRIPKDWDLFSFEVVPLLLLLLTFMPLFLQSNFRKTLITVLAYASMLVTFSYVINEASFGQRGYGRVKIELAPNMVCDNLTLNGHIKPLTIPGIPEGFYSAKLIDNQNKRSYDFHIAVVPNETTDVHMANYTPFPNK